MIKKIMIASMFTLSILQGVLANIKVINNLPWKIRFKVEWAGALPYIDYSQSNIAGYENGELKWRNSYTFEVPADSEREEGADAWNVKTRYLVDVWDNENNTWINKYDQKTSSGGNRKLTVTTKKINAETGDFEVDVTDGLM